MADIYRMDQEGYDAVQELERIQDQLTLARPSDRNPRLPSGGIDFALLLRSLETSGYDGFMGYECRGPFDADQLRTSVDGIHEQGRSDAD